LFGEGVIVWSNCTPGMSWARGAAQS
jgi:hypothetical protein